MFEWLLSILEQNKELELFVINFLGATFIPLPSDALNIAAVSTKIISPITVFFIATIATTLGSLVNYFIGSKGIHNLLIAKRNVEEEQRAEQWFNKYGHWIVLVHPWIPFLGDVMMIVAGTLRMNFTKFLLYAIIAKVVKNTFLVYLGFTASAIVLQFFN